MKNAFLILYIILMYYASNSSYIPLLPVIADFFRATPELAKITLNIFFIGSIAACFFGGLFGDRFGKINSLRLGMLLSTVGCLLCVFSPSIEYLMLGRFFIGFGSTIGMLIGVAAIAEIYPDELTPKIYTYLSIGMSFSFVTMPATAGYFAFHFSWKVIFLIFSFLFAIALFISLFQLPDNLGKKTKDSIWATIDIYKSIIFDWKLMSYIAISPVLLIGLYFAMTSYPFYFQHHLGLSVDAYGYYMTFVFIWHGIGAYVGNRLSSKYTKERVILFGLIAGVLSPISMVLMMFTYPELIIWGVTSLALYQACVGVVFPSTVASALNRFKNQTTKVSTVRTLVLAMGTYLGSFSSQFASDTSLIPVAGFLFMCILIVYTIFHFQINKAMK